MYKLRNYIIVFVFIGVFLGIVIYTGEFNDLSLSFWVFFVLCVIWLVGIYVMKKIEYKKISHLDFEKEKIYFREIIKKYSIGELSFIDGFQMDNPKDIISVLLKFERNNIIEIKDNRITVLDYDDSQLKYSEKYLLTHIEDDYLRLKDDLDYINAVRDECETDRLIEQISIDDRFSGFMNELKSMGLFYKIAIILLEAGSCGLFLLPILSVVNVIFVFLIIISFILGFCMTLVMIIIVLIKAFKHSGKLQVDHKLLDNGRELHSKLDGLKYYIKDFTKLNVEESQSIMLWDDYLIYSVMFGINKKIINKYKVLLKVDHYITEQEKAQIEFDNSDIKNKFQ